MADYRESLAEFERRDVAVVAVSTDPLVEANKAISELGLGYPVAFGLNAVEVAERSGIFYQIEENPGENFLHAAGFILDPELTVATAAYSTGPIGRLTPGDSIKMVDWLMAK